MRRRGLMVILVLSGVGASAALGWYAWRRYTAASPPEIVSEGLDPDLVEAIEKAQQQIRSDPYSAQRWGDLGKLLRAAQLVPEAVACFAQAERLEPKTPKWPYLQGEALRLSDIRAALPPLERAAALSENSNTIAPRLRLAEVLLALGLSDEAEKYLRLALELDPDDPSVHYNLGVLALARDDRTDSLAHLKHCEQSVFTQQKACIQLATVYRRMGQTEQADKYSRKADTLPPDRNWLDPFVGETLTVGRPARFEHIYHLELREDYRAAAEELTALIQQRPEYRAYVALGLDLGKLGDFAGAEQALRAARTMVPEKFKAHYELSRLLWMRAEKDYPLDSEGARAKYEEAAACARQAIARQPDSAMAHVLLGMSLRRLGKRQPAIDAFRTAVQCSPDLADAHLHLGETLADAGEMAEARGSLERAVQLARPEDPRPQAALARLKKN